MTSAPPRARAAWLLAVALLAGHGGPAGAQPPERAPATLIVTVPAGASLTIEGEATRQTGAERRYVSPPLVAGKTYVYSLTATWDDGGVTRKMERQVEVKAGKEVRVDLGGAVADRLRPPPGHVELFRVRAEGSQVYEAKPKAGDGAMTEWALKEPRAELFDDRGNKVGRHYRDAKLGAPAFELSDGSRVVVTLPPVASAPQPDAVPWLLLQAKVAEGDGKLGRVTYVQRVNTWAGRPPADAPAGEKAVKYEATYVFYGKRPE